MIEQAAGGGTLTPQFEPLFGSMLMGGFECATHRLRNRRRLDIIASSGHDVRAADDYRMLAAHGMRGARDGLRWHLIEPREGRYDWSSFVPMLRAARDTGTTVIWDLLHYGVPNGVDVFSPRFISRFAAFARAAARVFADETDAAPIITPVNEISFWAWGGGDTGGLNPFARGRGGELKRQLVRAALAAIAEFRAIDPRARIAVAEPLIHIMPADGTSAAAERAAQYNDGQFEAVDMLLGRMEPELGGSESAVDILGANYYFNNQWIDGGGTVPLGDWRHVPLHLLLGALERRYGKPLYIAETGTEGAFRPHWLHYVCDEVHQAVAHGVAIRGVCLYPIVSHLGWDDDRHCVNGMFDGYSADGPRHEYGPLAQEIAVQAARFSLA